MCRKIVVTEIVLCHKFSAPAGWVSEEYKNSRQRHGLVYVLEGRAIYQMRGENRKKSFVATAGDILYLSPDLSYITRCFEDSPFVHMTVNFLLAERDALSVLPTCLTPINKRKISQVFSRLVSEWTKRHDSYRVHSMSLLYELIGALLKEINREHDSYRQKLRPALNYLDKHFCEPVPEKKLFELCGMSGTYFRHLFKKVYKETAVEYRTRLRMGKACDLLLSGMYSVERVSAVCGYDDPAYFSRAFKKVMGKSPSQYRRNEM